VHKHFFHIIHVGILTPLSRLSKCCIRNERSNFQPTRLTHVLN